MIVGIGVDIADASRFGCLLARGGDGFRRRWFHADEIARCEASSDVPMAFALHYAAKEAVWKALGPPAWRDPLPWLDIVVAGESDGRSSRVRLNGRAAALAERVTAIHVSGARVRGLAMVTAVLEGD